MYLRIAVAPRGTPACIMIRLIVRAPRPYWIAAVDAICPLPRDRPDLRHWRRHPRDQGPCQRRVDAITCAAWPPFLPYKLPRLPYARIVTAAAGDAPRPIARARIRARGACHRRPPAGKLWARAVLIAWHAGMTCKPTSPCPISDPLAACTAVDSVMRPPPPARSRQRLVPQRQPAL